MYTYKREKITVPVDGESLEEVKTPPAMEENVGDVVAPALRLVPEGGESVITISACVLREIPDVEVASLRLAAAGSVLLALPVLNC